MHPERVRILTRDVFLALRIQPLSFERRSLLGGIHEVVLGKSAKYIDQPRRAQVRHAGTSGTVVPETFLRWRFALKLLRLQT